MRHVAAFLLLASAGCASSWREDYDRLRSDLEPLMARHEKAPPGPSTDEELDRLLSGPLDLATLLDIARTRSPELREALSRTRAGLEEVRRAGAFDDPTLRLQTEATPLHQPLAFDRAMDNTLGLAQQIPFPGNLGLRSEAALREAEATHQTYLERERDVAARLKKAYFELFALSRELEIHLEHVKILEGFEKVSDAKFRTGAVSQQDVLKPQVEMVLLHNEVLYVEQRLGTARAAINALLHRPAEAPLGRPGDVEPPRESFDLKELTAKALERPEVRAAELRARSTKAAAELARREATLPDFSVGVDYWQIPEGEDGWGGMLSVNLPWFTGKRSAEARKLEHRLRADEIALEGARSRVRFEVRDAFLRVEAARRSLVLFAGELLPKSAQGVEISRSSYENNKASFLDLLDAERSRRDVRLKHAQAAAQYESAVADLERAAGTDLRRKP